MSNRNSINFNRKKTKKILLPILTSIFFILLLIFALPFLPFAITIENVSINENQVIDITTDTGFESEYHWQNIVNGNDIVEYSYDNVANGQRSLYIESYGNDISNSTITYTGPNFKNLYEISNNLVLRLKMNYMDKLIDDQDSYLSITTFIVWNNDTLIPVKIVLGNFGEENDFVLPSGIIIVRNIPNSNEWTNYVLQMSKLVNPSVEYLRLNSINAFPEDDFQAFGLAIFPVNVKVLIDDFGYSLVTPAEITFKLRSNSVTSMSSFLTNMKINNIESDYELSEDSEGPFNTFLVKSIIPRPLIKGEQHSIELTFSTGQKIEHTITVEKSPYWI